MFGGRGRCRLPALRAFRVIVSFCPWVLAGLGFAFASIAYLVVALYAVARRAAEVGSAGSRRLNLATAPSA